jgi:HJR/Mrr/RecB family endonuclease
MSQVITRGAAPGSGAAESSILAKIIGQSAVADPAVAEHDYNTAKAAHKAACQQVRRVRRSLQYHKIRLWVAKSGIAAWATVLIVGSPVAIVLAVMLIFAGSGLGTVFTVALLAYVVCGGAAFWLLRPSAGETGDDWIAVRATRLKDVEALQSDAFRAMKERAAAVEKANELLQSIKQTLQSEAYKRRVETNRLLSIDPGRLYPDEFEKYVGDIFRHLGFTVALIGKSGDQGVDVIACRGLLRVAIQTKRYIGSVGNAAVQEVYAGMAHHRCQRGVVVTNSAFTPGAVALGESTGCVLIGSDRMAALIRGEIPF